MRKRQFLTWFQRKDVEILVVIWGMESSSIRSRREKDRVDRKSSFLIPSGERDVWSLSIKSIVYFCPEKSRGRISLRSTYLMNGERRFDFSMKIFRQVWPCWKHLVNGEKHGWFYTVQLLISFWKIGAWWEAWKLALGIFRLKNACIPRRKLNLGSKGSIKGAAANSTAYRDTSTFSNGTIEDLFDPRVNPKTSQRIRGERRGEPLESCQRRSCCLISR
jgi:hypothetical protein